MLAERPSTVMELPVAEKLSMAVNVATEVNVLSTVPEVQVAAAEPNDAVSEPVQSTDILRSSIV
jgi:hypothetical protein